MGHAEIEDLIVGEVAPQLCHELRVDGAGLARQRVGQPGRRAMVRKRLSSR
jgi:hypothetical protein